MDQDRYNILLSAIEEERKHEEAYFKSLDNAKSKEDKIKSGILWSPVLLIKKHYGVGEHIEMVFERTKQLNQPHKFKTGIACNILYETHETIALRGAVSFVRGNKMGVILNSTQFDKDYIPDNGSVSIRMIYDERPYKVMKSTIETLKQSKEEHIKALREGIRRKSKFDEKHYDKKDHVYIDESLNEAQKEAVKGLLTSLYFGIIHGPPGTGKTTTIVALIRSLLQVEKRILVCAPSNNAVDLLVRKLDEKGIKVLRLGNVTRIGDSVSHLTLAEKVRSHDDWQHIKKVRIESEAAKKEARTHKRKFGAKEHANRRALYKEAKELKRWADDLEDKLVSNIFSSTQVVACTLIGAANRRISDLNFDTVVIDEASQTLEAECWTAMIKARRCFLAGDHLQLPPTVKSPKAKELGLDQTLLDRMADGIDHAYLLKEQYRMHDLILGFSNQQFYNGELFSNELVKDRLLAEGDQVITFIDTSGCGFDESMNSEHRSYKNEGEFFILREHMLKNVSLLQGNSIGIISPYAEQVRFIRRSIAGEDNLKELDVQVDSVDGFQGQEKDVIYVSLVRSNDMGQIGFVKDARRLNVALTRAKMKLVIIGDMATLSSEKIFNELVEYVESKNSYQSAWEYMA